MTIHEEYFPQTTPEEGPDEEVPLVERLDTISHKATELTPDSTLVIEGSKIYGIEKKMENGKVELVRLPQTPEARLINFYEPERGSWTKTTYGWNLVEPQNPQLQWANNEGSNIQGQRIAENHSGFTEEDVAQIEDLLSLFAEE
jgi:hypothetical protein